MSKPRLDWKPVVRSLVLHLVEHDIIPLAIYDGAYRREIDRGPTEDMAAQAANAACAVDEASLRCAWYTATSELRCNLLLVFGNEPHELVSDYCWTNGDDALEAAVEEALDGFEAEWEGKPCPQTQAAA